MESMGETVTILAIESSCDETAAWLRLKRCV